MTPPAAGPTRAASTPTTAPVEPPAPRERIIEAVIEALPQLDPAALTIQQMCDRAQVAPPTIYYHFGSKEGMVAAAVDALVTRWLAQLDAIIDRAGSLEQMLLQARTAWGAMITAPSRPFAVFVWLAMWSDASRPALLRARARAQEFIRDALLLHLGQIPDAEELAGTILDGLLGVSVDYQLDADERMLESRLATLLSIVSLRAAAPDPDLAEPDPSTTPQPGRR